MPQKFKLTQIEDKKSIISELDEVTNRTRLIETNALKVAS